ncbi:hypothetical protein D9758_012186 [Tetrapyrgos nigripes]|uniref:HD/PDEase domain-containing protein n=1 Tax=Tetrapyrgos nigripes TaxID=182062 RepID=A0A8H5CHZ5_9AGAR|nr:hypothetical protein D9758_012186 [Tetrapyrgos nigripes]
MYPNADEKVYIDEAEKLMVETMARYDPSHDAYHGEYKAHDRDDAVPSKPDLLTVELAAHIAALLHDILDKKYASPEQAANPYTFFLPFFTSVAEKSGIDLVKDGRARQIAEIVDNVSWTTEKKLRAKGEWGKWHDECVELHCVQDADRLDAIGAFGVLRCAAFSASKNYPLHVPNDDPALEVSAMQHFEDKLVHIKDRLKTKPGKTLGERKHQVLLDFMKSVQEEYDLSNLQTM